MKLNTEKLLKKELNWKAIEGFEGVYLISDCGLVQSVSRTIDHPKHGFQFIEGRILKPGTDGWGYQFVYLRKDGKSHMRKLHRLVAIAFIENSDNCPEVNHEDGNKKNNHHSNLKWCTSQYNMQHSFAMGLNKPRIGKDNSSSKAVMQIDKAGNLIEIHDSVSGAERKTGILNTHISQCAIGKKHHKTAGGYRWQYV